MGWFLKIWLLVLTVLISRTRSQSTFLMNISSEFVPIEDKLAECLLFILRDPKLNFMINIRIHMEVESTFFRRKFENTIQSFCATNDRVLVDMNSDESASYNTHGRLYFIDSLNSLKSLELLIKRQRENDRDLLAANQNYFIVLPTNDEGIIRSVLHFCWKNFIINVNVLVEDTNGYVNLYTYYPFTEEGCSDSTPTIHNRFINGSLEWTKPTFPSKTKNFWQCPLKAVLWEEPPFVIMDSEQLSGLDGVTLRTLAADLNFSVEIIISEGGKGINYPNGSATGAFKMIKDGLGDFTIGGISIVKLRYDHFAATSSYYMSTMDVVIKQPEPYSPMEILLFPFDLYTWLSILILLIGNWIGGFVWKRISNAVVPFWQYSMKPLLIAWLLTVLILCSSYEGSIFQYLHNRPNKAPPKNLDEAIDAGYKFIVWPQAYQIFSQVPRVKNKLIPVNVYKTEVFELFTTLEGKYGILTWLDILPQYRNDSSKFGNHHVVQKPVMSIHPCIYLPKFSYLTKEFSIRLSRMVRHGIMKKIIDTTASMEDFRKKKKIDEIQKSLKLHQLLGAFQMLGIFMGASTCVLVIELLSRRNQILKTVIDFLQ